MIELVTPEEVRYAAAYYNTRMLLLTGLYKHCSFKTPWNHNLWVVVPVSLKMSINRTSVMLNTDKLLANIYI